MNDNRLISDSFFYTIIATEYWLVGWLVGWYGLSTFVVYLMPNPFLYK